ncbi:MAG: muramidase [Aureispira sp.]|nr:muramidase [Aureispira sp.]
MKKIIGIPVVLYILFALIYEYNKGPEEPKSTYVQELNAQYYIKEYSLARKNAAVQEMFRTGVPASITLAQAILESKYGQSELATKANNHFGIKCGKSWIGDRYCIHSNEWDSKKNGMVKRLGCFRSYNSLNESFKDHSDFLRASDRYAPLFEFSTTNYKSWAEGLQKAGYATDPKYAKKLISLIERYELNQYDVALLEQDHQLVN